MGAAKNGKLEKADRSGSGKAANRAEPKFGYINYELTAKDKERLEALIPEDEVTLEDIYGLVTSGYKFSLSEDEKHKRFVAALTDKSPDSAFWNQCLTGSGASAADATFALLYKHRYACDGDWANFPPTVENRYG